VGFLPSGSSHSELCRQSEEERGPLVRLRRDPDASSAAFHNLLNDGQADSGAWKLGRTVQPLEDFEDSVGVLRIDPNAIVFNRENPF